MVSLFDLAADALDVGAGALGIYGTRKAASDEDQLLQQQEQVAEAQFYQQGLQRTRRVRQMMAQATAEEAARGVSAASPSFKAVQRSSFERFQEDQDVAALNLSFTKKQLEAKRKEVRDKEKVSAISTIGKVIGEIF